MNVALKEWHTVCRALASGRQMILLRKGGISEDGDGEFHIEHNTFLMFPTFVHQNLTMLKPGAQQDFVAASSEPETIRLETFARVTDIFELRDRFSIEQLDTEHIWTKPLIDMRFSYKPDRPLYLVIVRAYCLPEPADIVNTPEYAGCKSWVNLTESIDIESAQPAITDGEFEQRRGKIRAVLM
jgi:hypothetical protein